MPPRTTFLSVCEPSTLVPVKDEGATKEGSSAGDMTAAWTAATADGTLQLVEDEAATAGVVLGVATGAAGGGRELASLAWLA